MNARESPATGWHPGNQFKCQGHACSSPLAGRSKFVDRHLTGAFCNRSRIFQGYGSEKPARVGLSRELRFFGGVPTVLDERLSGYRSFVHRKMEYVLLFLELHRKGCDVHALLPQSGGDLARETWALGEPKPELFHLRHDLDYTYGRRQSDNAPQSARDYDISGRANFNPHKFQPLANATRTMRAFSNRIP